MTNQLEKNQIRQPVSVDWHAKEEPTAKERNLTVNPETQLPRSLKQLKKRLSR